jgi:outer membrane protein TolC
MLTVETAYWTAVGAHQEVRVLEEIVNASKELWDREKEMLKVGKGSIPNVSQSEEQHHDFRVQQMEAQLQFDEAVRELLRVMGYPTTAEVSVALATQALDLDYEPNWELAKYRLHQRPELLAQQAAIDAAEIAVRQATNGLRPDLRLRAVYASTGLEESLDDAMSTMSRNQFNDWSLGLVYRQPLGRRADAAAAQSASVGLRREQLAYDQIQHDLIHELRNALQRLVTTRDIAQLQTKRRVSAVEQFQASRELYEGGRVNLLDQLQAQQIASEARIDEIRAIIQFNIAIATWRFTQGDFEDCYQLETPTGNHPELSTSPLFPEPAQPQGSAQPRGSAPDAKEEPKEQTQPRQDAKEPDTTTAWLLPPPK